MSANSVGEKGRFDYVTSSDRRSEEIVIRMLRAHFPDHQILAEESGCHGDSKSPFRWLIDPLDGTTNYIHGFPLFCASIALEVEGTMRLGVAYDPLREETFTVLKGRGARLNQRRIHVSSRKRLAQSLIATGFPFRIHKRLDSYLRQFRSFFDKASGIRRAGSAVLDLCYVACGRFDGFWEMGLSPWDMAAGALMVQEAGGKSSDFEGKNKFLRSGDIAATNGLIHRQMLSILTSKRRIK